MSRWTDTAHQYIEDVLSGRRVAGRLTRLACERQARDLDQATQRGWVWDEKAASRICAFAEQIPHVEGRWDTPNLVLQPWQCFWFTTLFGWLSATTGLRRFLRGYLEVAKKNGKTYTAAVVGLFLTRFDGEPGAKVFSAATSRDQAREVWNAAQAAVRSSPYLAKKGLKAGEHSIVHRASNSLFRPLASDDKSNDGKNAHGVIVDELWAHPNGLLYANLDEARAARRQPLLLAITTAGFDVMSFCYSKHLQARDLLEGRIEDDRFFPLIYALDDREEWRDRAAWEKANPSLGVTLDPEILEAQRVNAETDLEGRTTFLTKRMNLWLESRQSWMDPDVWSACGRRSIEPSDLAGRTVYVALDLASVLDLASIVAVASPAEPGDRWLYFSRNYLPRRVFEARALTTLGHHWQKWEREGFLTVTEGPATDFDRIERDAIELCQATGAVGVGVDPYQAVHLGQHLEKAGYPVVEVRQVVEVMSPAMKEVNRLALEGLVEHGANPVLAWCIGNVKVKVDRKDNIYPTKEREAEKIDAAVALFMGHYLGMTNPIQPASVYESYDPRRRTYSASAEGGPT